MDRQTDKPTQEPTKVVKLFADRKVSADSSAGKAEDAKPSEESFLDSMRRNADNAERLRKERLKANQGVLKSYRIKN